MSEAIVVRNEGGVRDALVAAQQEIERVRGEASAAVARAGRKLRDVKQRATQSAELPLMASGEGALGGAAVAVLEKHFGDANGRWRDMPIDVLVALASTILAMGLIIAEEDELAPHALFLAAGASGATGYSIAKNKF